MANGCVRSDVIRALKAHKVFVALEDANENLYALERDAYLEKKVLSPTVPMWLLNEFKRKLDIPIQHFWHPEDAEGSVDGQTEPSEK